MPAIYQGDKKIVDRYVGETLVTRAYQGDKLIFDAYSELSNTLPLAVRSRASQVLENYRIYGESVQDGTPTPDNPVEVTGLGVRTVNLYNYANDVPKKYISDSGALIGISGSVNYVSDKMPVTPGKTYTLVAPLTITGNGLDAAFYGNDDTALSVINISSTVSPYEKTYTITAPSGAAYFRTSIKRAVGAQSTTMFVEGSTAPTSYIPYGYKLPLTVRTVNLWDNYFANGTYESGGFRPNVYHICGVEKILIKANTQYSISYVSTYPYPIDRQYLYEFDAQGERLRQSAFSGKSFTTSSDAVFCTISVGSTTLGITPNDISNFMLVEGSTPPDHYIPYYNTETPIYIGGTQLMRIPDTEYADYVDYEKGKIIRRVKKLVLTGEEDFVYMKYSYSYTFVLDIPDISWQTARVLSTHLQGADSIPAPVESTRTDKIFTTLVNGYKHSAIGIGSGRWSGSENAFKTFLADQYAAGTPVTVWYVLETPVEEDPPVPFPDITLPKGEVTIDIEGNLKPEVTVKGRINPTV